MTSRASYFAVCVASVALLLSACDEVSVRMDDPSRPVTLQQRSSRVLFPAAGIAGLFDIAYGDTFELSAVRDSETFSDDGLALGPIKQGIPVTTRSSRIQNNQIVLTTRIRAVSVLVPVRVRSGVELSICRYRVSTPAIDVVARLGLSVEEGSSRMEVADAPVLDVDRADVEVNAVGVCAHDDAMPEGFENVLVDYVFDGVSASTVDALTTSPLELGGVVEGRLELDRRARFSNRRGTLAFESQVDAETSVILSERGIDVSIDIGVSATRARCAPPIDVSELEPNSAALVDAESAEELEADVAMSLSNSLVQSLSHSMILSGFACRGLETTPSDAAVAHETSRVFAVEALRLEDIDLESVDSGTWVQASSIPGSVPTITPRSRTGDLRLEWENLTLELYGEVRGAPARILTLDTAASIVLRPRRNTVGVIRFDVDSIQVDSASLESPWQVLEPENEALEIWAQRTLLLVLQDQFVLPVPLMAPTSLRVAATEVRDDDVVLYMMYE